MADICEATKACSSEPGARETANEARRFRFVPVVKAVLPADDAERKRRRLDSSASSSPVVLRSDPGDDCVENRPEHGDGTGEGVAGECPGYGVTSICGRRREMEDAVSVRPYFVRGDHRYHFFGVYDGHGCSHVAESCRNRMHEVVAEEISTSRPGSDREWCAVMERSFARMDAAGRPGDPPPAPTCRCELQTPRCDHVGSTAVVAVVGPDRIVVANCGDSRAVLCHDGALVPLSTDHKPDRPDELRRIEAAGGRVMYWDGARVLGVLAMSRTIEDNYLKPYVISEPEVTVTERKEGDECLLLASDGLWDAVSNEVACGIARTCLRNSTAAAGDDATEGDNCGGGSDKGCSDAAVLLTKLALARHSTDNVSVVVINLRRL